MTRWAGGSRRHALCLPRELSRPLPFWTRLAPPISNATVLASFALDARAWVARVLAAARFAHEDFLAAIQGSVEVTLGEKLASSPEFPIGRKRASTIPVAVFKHQDMRTKVVGSHDLADQVVTVWD
jgi:hypothetical protein